MLTSQDSVNQLSFSCADKQMNKRKKSLKTKKENVEEQVNFIIHLSSQKCEFFFSRIGVFLLFVTITKIFSVELFFYLQTY